MILAKYLQEEAGLSAEMVSLVDSLCTSTEFSKGQLILNEGSYSKKLFYIEKGLIRAYYFKEDKEITQEFFAEKSIITSIESIFFNQPSYYYYEVMERTTVRTVDFSKIEMLMEEDVKLQRFVIFVLMAVIKKTEERLIALQFQSAQERYKKLLETSPDILLRAPLGQIASYLGITQSTLSVIRADKST